MRFLRFAIAPLHRADTYRRWVYLVVCGALFVPFYLAVAVPVSLLAGAPGEDGAVTALTVIALPAAAVLGGATAFLPGVAAQVVAITRALVRGPFAAEPIAPIATVRDRTRAAGWLGLHLLVGFGVSVGTMVALTESALLALTPLVPERATLFDIWASGSTAARWQTPILGAALLVATVYGVAFIGAVSARVAPLLLSPPASARLAAVQARADQLMQRNRLAADLHDSIGHALSVVALQAGAAARVIDHDPRFAREALDAIAEQARTATGELDHVLGVLREERPTTDAPRTLADLPHLVEAARTAGADVRWERTGPLAAVPPVVSREAYRLCQEGLTNALRHGDRSAPITVEVHVDDDRLRISIANRTPARRVRGAGGGRGLPGLAERFALLGGELASTEHDRTWRLDAEVPWGSAR